MKTKRQGQSKLFVVLATLLAIVFFSFAGETNVKAAETYTQNYTPTRKSPLKKIEYINRGDNTFDINVTVDLSVYYPNDVLGIQEYDLTAWTNGTSGKEYVASQCGNIDVRFAVIPSFLNNCAVSFFILPSSITPSEFFGYRPRNILSITLLSRHWFNS